MNLKRITTYIIILWIGIIWANSLMPADISSIQSGFVVSVFSYVFNVLGLTVSDDLLSMIIRTSAHYIEFMILGILLSIRFSKMSYVYLMGTFVLLMDEIIQIFVPGRAFEIKDLLVDSFGLLTGMFLVYLILRLINNNRTKSLESTSKP